MQVIRQSASGQQQPPITTDALFRLQILVSGIIFLIYGNCILYDMQIVLIIIISGVLRWLEMNGEIL